MTRFQGLCSIFLVSATSFGCIQPADMIVGNRRTGAFLVVSILALLVLSLIAVIWSRKNRKVIQQAPIHASLIMLGDGGVAQTHTVRTTEFESFFVTDSF